MDPSVDMDKPKINCTITRISRPEDVPGGLRTVSVKGYTVEVPKLEKPFQMLSTPLETTVGVRYIETSPVKVIVKDPLRRVVRITTLTGSIYEVAFENPEDFKTC